MAQLRRQEPSGPVPERESDRLQQHAGPSAQKPATSRGRLLKLSLGGLLLVAALLLLTEGILRVAGYGAPSPLLELYGRTPHESSVWRSTDDWPGRFFLRSQTPGNEQVGSFYAQYIETPKPADVFRVAVFGESTVQGYPYPPNVGIASAVERNLQSVLPDHRVEVLNFGFTAVASYPVSCALEESLEFGDFDAIVILTAHNEFFGAYGVASFQYAGGTRSALRRHEFLQQIRLVQATRAAVAGVRSAGSSKTGDTGEGSRRLIEVMAGDEAIGPDDERRQRAATLLAQNIGAMIDLCQARSIPVVVGTMPSCLSTFAPVGPIAKDATDDEKLFADAASASGERKISILRQGASADSTNALRAFRYGEALRDAGRFDDARIQFTRARDLDGMPWRAPTASNERIRELAAERGVVLADCEKAFLEAGLPEGPGWDLFVDHVHPSVQGRVIYGHELAAAVLRATDREDQLAALPPPDDVRFDIGGEEPTTLWLGASAMEVLFSHPPMSRNNEAAHEWYSGLKPALERIMDPEDRAALRQYQDLRDGQSANVTALFLSGVLKMQSGKFAEAIGKFRQVRRGSVNWQLLWVQAATNEGLSRVSIGMPMDAAFARELVEARRGLAVIRDSQKDNSVPPYMLDFVDGQLLLLQGEATEGLKALERSRDLATPEQRGNIEHFIAVAKQAQRGGAVGPPGTP